MSAQTDNGPSADNLDNAQPKDSSGYNNWRHAQADAQASAANIDTWQSKDLNNTATALSPIGQDMLAMADNVQIIGDIFRSNTRPARHGNHAQGQGHNYDAAALAAQNVGPADNALLDDGTAFQPLIVDGSVFHALAKFTNWQTRNLVNGPQVTMASKLLQR